jgi:hypothetical protein
MESSYSRIGTVAAALVVGAAIGYAIGKAAAPRPDPCHVRSDHNVGVALDGSLDCPEVVIGPPNTVTWRAPVGTTVAVTYQGTGVFHGATCGSNWCFSGRPTVIWGPSETRRTVDYTLVLTDGVQNKSTKGRIIIDK